MFELASNLSLQFKALAALVAIVLVGSAARAKLANRRRLPLPPGPPGHWLFGNTLPKANQSQQFNEWVNQYGPVISLRVGSETMVIIGRLKESVDIMEKEGSLLADRPRWIAPGEMLSGGMRVIFTPVGEQFRRLRKVVHTHLQAKAVESYAPIQMHAASEVILSLLEDPKHHVTHANRYAASVILRITYGKSTPTDMHSPEMIAIHKALYRLQVLTRPGAMLVEKYPIMKYVPGYARHVYAWHREELALFRDQMSRVETEMKSGEAGPSFVRHLIETQDSHKLSHTEMAYLGGNMFGAGSDTTAVGINGVIMAAACHPEAQRILHEELDNVVGRDRAPTFDDYDSLPQLQAFMLESLRWRPVVTVGLAHRATADVPYKDFCIPKGAIVLGNHWAISRDPEAYPNPDKFDPQRWLLSDGSIRDDIKFPGFGFGRRICPGQYLASRSIFINMALILWSFRIAEDPKSPIDQSFTDGVVAHLSPFEARFIPRVGDETFIREVMAKYPEGQ